MKAVFVAPDDWTIYNFKMPVVREVKNRGHNVVVVTPCGENVKEIESEGCKWREWKLKHHSINPFKEFKSLARLSSIYLQEKPDVVHHYTAKGILYGTIAAKVCKVSSIVNAVTGGVSALGNVVSGREWIYKTVKWLVNTTFELLLGGTEVIFQNPDDRNSFIGKGIVAEKRAHLVNGSGADLEKFQGEDEIEKDEITVILAGRLLWDKGVGEFVEAARLMEKRGEDMNFVLVGEAGGSNPKSVSQDQIRSWEREGIIEWWGFCEDMPDVFRRAHIVCSPTYYREGVPKVLIEAAASERPIVTTDMPGCREIVRDGENGILIPPKDPEALAEALLTLANSKPTRRRMGRRGREIVKEEFSVERVVEQTMNVYDKILER